MIISCLSQKGGVGKSSLARTIAVELTRAKWDVLLADIDASQKTSNRWSEIRRNKKGVKPSVKAESFSLTHKALAKEGEVNLLVIDGAPHATKGTLDAALASDLVLIPTGTSIDDLETQIFLANELVEKGVNKDSIYFVVYCVASKAQEREAKESIKEFEFNVYEETVLFSAGYINAFDSGKCATETRHSSLNKKAGALIKAIVKTIKG